MVYELNMESEVSPLLVDGIYKVQPIMCVSSNVYRRVTRREMTVLGTSSSLVQKYKEIYKLVELYMLVSDTNVDSITGKHFVMMYTLHCELTYFVLI